MRHWERIMVNACEQCGRSRLPGIDRPTGFTAWLDAGFTADTRILLDPEAGTSLTGLEPSQQSILLLAGPEGGITNAEKLQAGRAGFTPVALGPRVLRTETAPLAVLAGLQLLWGDFR